MLKDTFTYHTVISNDRGAVAVLVAICLVVLIGFVAFAIDLNHLMTAKNELQNAADAGALAGARTLYNENGASINTDCNQDAYDIATDNNSENAAVEVNWTGGNTGDIQRGHWSFINNDFTANSSDVVVNFWNYTSEELDTNTDFINAVRVVTRRSNTPIISFFARIFDYSEFEMSAEAVAYIGFSGSTSPVDVDQPIAICRQSILGEDDSVACNIGRMINSGINSSTNNTAGWTNFTQPCSTASNNWMSSLICSDYGDNYDLKTINFGAGIGSTGGNLSDILRDLQDCWVDSSNNIYDEDGNLIGTIYLDSDDDGIPEHPWVLNLLVIDCPGNNVSNCATVMGVVRVEMLWILDNQNTNSLDQVQNGLGGAEDVPYKMYYDPYTVDNSSNENNPDLCWNANTLDSEFSDEFNTAFSGATYNKDNPVHRWWYFVMAFNLKNADGDIAPYQNMAMYFTPRCDYGERVGTTQGDNYGILAKIPVLVK